MKSASVVLSLLVVFGFASAAEAQQKAKKSAPNQYTVPSDQERWYDPSCNTFNT
jgi:hypothetical protein